MLYKVNLSDAKHGLKRMVLSVDLGIFPSTKMETVSQKGLVVMRGASCSAEKSNETVHLSRVYRVLIECLLNKLVFFGPSGYLLQFQKRPELNYPCDVWSVILSHHLLIVDLLFEKKNIKDDDGGADVDDDDLVLIFQKVCLVHRPVSVSFFPRLTPPPPFLYSNILYRNFPRALE